MTAEQRVKLHIGELTVTIHALQAEHDNVKTELEKLKAEHDELKKKLPPDTNQ